MRIALFTEYYYPYISGVTTHIETLANSLKKAGHKVLIVALDPNVKKHTYKNGVLLCPARAMKKIYGYGMSNPINHLRTMFIKHFNPDIIHMQTEFTMGMFAMRCARQLQKPLVYTLHTMYDDYAFYVIPKLFEGAAKPLLHTYIRSVAKKAAQVIGPSKKVADYLKLCGVQKEINVIPNTVDVKEFLPENVAKEKVDAVKEQLKIKEGDTALCFVSRIGKEKSIDVLIDYFWKCFAGEENYKLFIIGEGPERETLEEQIKNIGANAQIKMLGRIEHEELPPYYQACDMFATASLTEMNSISLIEANASGLYTAHRLDADNLDQIEDGVNGKFFETQKEFEEIVREHSHLSDKAKAKRKKAVTEYAKRYGPKEFCEAVVEVYEKVL